MSTSPHAVVSMRSRPRHPRLPSAPLLVHGPAPKVTARVNARMYGMSKSPCSASLHGMLHTDLMLFLGASGRLARQPRSLSCGPWVAMASFSLSWAGREHATTGQIQKEIRHWACRRGPGPVSRTNWQRSCGAEATHRPCTHQSPMHDSTNTRSRSSFPFAPTLASLQHLALG